MRTKNALIALVSLAIGLAGPLLAADGQSLAAYWKLNESSGTSVADSAGSNTGTVTGTTNWVAGYINNGFQFNGSTKIQATGLIGNPANITLAAWINLTTADSSGSDVISLGDHVMLRVDAGTNTQLNIYDGSAWQSFNVTSTTLAGTGWHHVVGVFDDTNNTWAIYLDGALAASGSSSASISYAGQGSNTVLGRHGNGSTNMDFTGTIDDVRVYNYALSAAEVLDVWGRALHWKLDETSGTSAADASAYNRVGTVTGSASWGSAVINNGFTFNGSTKIQATGLINNPTSISLAAWAKLTTADTNGAEVISLGDRVFLRLDDGGLLKASFYNGSSFVTVSYSQTYAGTGWHHFAAVFNNPSDTFKLYVDGAQVASLSTSANISYAGGGANTLIGTHGNGNTNYDFTGSIDDVRIYRYALSASDVAALYGLIGYWKLSETSGTTANDATVFARNGALTGSAAWSTDCGGMGVFDFNGSTHVFTVANATDFQPTTMWSAAAWIKGDTWGSGSSANAILRKGDTNPNNYALQVSDGRVELLLDGNDAAGIRGNTVLNTGQWYHVAVTWDGTTGKVYVNGVLDNSPGVARAAPIGTDTRPLYLGGRAGADYFDGMIREIRFYNRALSATDVQKLAGLVAHWPFSEGSGTAAADTSGQAENATLSGATWTTSCAGDTALATNGAGGVAQTAAPFTPPATGTVAFWMKSSGTPVTTGRLFGNGGDWEMRQMNDGKIYDDLGADAATTICTPALNVAGQWYHVAATYNATTNFYSIYIDGALTSSGTHFNTIVQQPSGVLSFGTRTGSTEYWQGALREFRIYSRTLCPKEIADLACVVENWKLDQTSGTTATETSIFANNGTYTNGVTLNQSGPQSGQLAAQFDGTNDYVGLPTRSRDYSNGFTVALWARPTAAGSGARFIDIGNGAPSNNIYFGRNSTTDTLEFAVYSGGAGTTYNYVRATNAITLNQWHHYAATVNSAGLAQLYRDGAQISATSGSAGYPTIGLPNNVTRTLNYIGRSNWGTDAYYQGKMYDVRVYNRCLCPTEIQTLYGSGAVNGVRIIKWVEVQ